MTMQFTLDAGKFHLATNPSTRVTWLQLDGLNLVITADARDELLAGLLNAAVLPGHNE